LGSGGTALLCIDTRLLVAPDSNVVVHFNLAHVLGKQGNLNEAVTHFSEACG
jgi:hypothetical protein